MRRRERHLLLTSKGFFVLGVLVLCGALFAASSAYRPPTDAAGKRSGHPTVGSWPRWEHMEFPGVAGNPPRVASGGDLNGDGYDDLVIGAPLENQSNGVVVVFYGSPEGLRKRPDWQVDGQRQRARLGAEVALGDFDGDRISDVAVSSCLQLPGGEAWKIDVYCGSTNGLSRSSQTSLPNSFGPIQITGAFRNAGDVNGDGFGDLAVRGMSSERGSNAPPLEVVLLFHGSKVGLSSAPSAVLRAEQDNSNFAAPFESAGDVNGDGYDDFCIGAYTYSGRYHRGGKVYLYLGSPEGLGSTPVWTSVYPLKVTPGIDDEKNQHFGLGLGPAGDVNGDGYADVIIGAAFASHGEINEGVAFLYLGSKQGLSRAPAWHTESNQPHAMFGYSVARLGDLNGDGCSEVIVGAPQAEHGQKDEGAAVVFYGSKKGLSKHAAWTFDGDYTTSRMGTLVLGAGDLNGDGVPDLLIAGQYLLWMSDPVKSRILVQYGSAGGLQGSSNWRIEKPFLAAAQQWLDRSSREQLWFGCTAVAAAAIVVLLYLQAKLKLRMAALVQRNRELALAEERARLARDVHDHLGADLTHLAVEIDRVRDMAPQSTRDRLTSLSGFAGRLGNAVRELVWATNPERDTLDDTASFLSEQVSSFLEAHRIPCDLDFPLKVPPLRIRSALRHNLLLMLKEVLHNIVQHAHATRVYVVFRLEDHSARLEIRDDGDGLKNNANGVAPLETGRNRGLGLRNLHLRAAELGGSITISAEPGHGTRIVIVVPITSPDSEAGPSSTGTQLRKPDSNL